MMPIIYRSMKRIAFLCRSLEHHHNQFGNSSRTCHGATATNNAPCLSINSRHEIQKKASSSHEAIDPTVTSDARAPGLNPESAVHPNARVRPLTTEPTARPGAEAIDGPGSLRPPIQPESRLREDETDLVSAHLVEGDEQRQQHIPGPLVMASPMEEAPREDDYHVSRRDMKRYCIIGGSMILLVLVGIALAVVLLLNNQSSSPIVSAGSSPSTPVPTFAPHVLSPSKVEPTFSLPPTDNDKEPSPSSTTTALPTSVSTGVTGPLPTVSPTRISTSAPITPPPTSFPTTLPPTPMPTPPPSPAPTPLPTPEPSAALTPPPTPEPSPPLTPPPTPEPTPPLTPPPTTERTLLPTPRPTSVCDSNPCVNGDCVDKGDSFECDCFDLWTGDLCDEQTSPCNPNPCVHGECTVTSNGIDGYECDCDEGWYGYDDCSVNIYERCNPNPCASGELCLPRKTILMIFSASRIHASLASMETALVMEILIGPGGSTKEEVSTATALKGGVAICALQK